MAEPRPPASDGQGQGIPGRVGSLASLLVVTAAVELYLWWGKFQFHHSRWLVATVFLVAVIVASNHCLRRDSRKLLGLRHDNWKYAALLYGLATLAGVFAIVPAGFLFGGYSPPTWIGAGSYLLWALVQQYLLQNFYQLRLSEALGGKTGARILSGVAGSAVAFSVLHWPNHSLVLLTLLGGLVWCCLFRRTPNLWAAAGSQAVVTLTLMLFFKFGALQQFEVGAPGKRFDYYGQGVRVAGGYDSQGVPRIATLPAPNPGYPSRVKIFDAKGELQHQWVAYPELDYSGELAIGHLTDPGDQIVVAPGPGHTNPPELRVFSFSGELLKSFPISSLPPGYGAFVAVACGRIYAASGPGPAAPQRIVELNPEGTELRRWEFSDLPFENGLRGTALCPSEEQPVTPAPSRLLLWGSDMATNPSSLFLFDTESARVERVESLRTTFGAQVCLMKLEEEPVVAVSAGPLRGHPAVVQIQTLSGERIRNITFSQDPDQCGSSIGAVDLDGDGTDELIVGEGTGRGRGFQLQLWTAQGTLLNSWAAYREEEFR